MDLKTFQRNPLTFCVLELLCSTFCMLILFILFPFLCDAGPVQVVYKMGPFLIYTTSFFNFCPSVPLSLPPAPQSRCGIRRMKTLLRSYRSTHWEGDMHVQNGSYEQNNYAISTWNMMISCGTFTPDVLKFMQEIFTKHFKRLNILHAHHMPLIALINILHGELLLRNQKTKE